MKVFKSRFTLNTTGDKIKYQLGDKVKYQLKDGSIIDAIIDSELMSHHQCKNLGYEAITLDDNQRAFIDSKRIIWWDGKIETTKE